MIRTSAPNDTEAMLEVWRNASAVGHPFLTADFLDEEERRLREQWLPASSSVVAEIDGRVVGFLSLVGSVVGGLFVDPAHHRQGIATELLGWAVEQSDTLTLEVFEENEGARRFYEARSFRQVSRNIEPETGRRQVVMRRQPTAPAFRLNPTQP